MKLCTLDGKYLGTIDGVAGLQMNIRYAEPSEMTFEVDVNNKLYDKMVGLKMIDVGGYGKFVIKEPEESNNGIEQKKTIRCYSLEQVLEHKRFFLEDGTYNFYGGVPGQDSIIDRVLEIADDWSIGFISPTLIGKYRTFTMYDDNLLSFIYDDAADKYGCIFVFDTAKKTISAIDKQQKTTVWPVYLNFDNLISNLTKEEMTSELITAMRPYGADELNIRLVNPTGTNWLYNLSYFISNGDIQKELGNKWKQWVELVNFRRYEFVMLMNLKASNIAKVSVLNAKLTKLNGELQDLKNQQSVTIQAQALEKTQAGKDYQQNMLNEINAKMRDKNAEVSAVKNEIDQANAATSASVDARIKEIINEVKFEAYFTKDEQRILRSYMIEQDFTDETFVVPTARHEMKTTSLNVDSITFKPTGEIEEYRRDGAADVYTIGRGRINMVCHKPNNEAVNISGDIIRGTIENAPQGSHDVMTLRLGRTVVDGDTYDTMTITAVGELTNFNPVRYPKDVTPPDYAGSGVSLIVSGVTFNNNATMTIEMLNLMTNADEFGEFAVQQELLEHASKQLNELAYPTYEFSVDAGNFLFAEKFEQFRDKFVLGDAVHLNVGSSERKEIIRPKAIEVSIDFDDPSNFSILFSNRYQRKDNVNVVKNMIESSYSSSRKFDASKHAYNQTKNNMSDVSRFMNSSLDAAVNNVLGAANQSVVIDGAGIHIGGDDKKQMRIVNNMIAMTDNAWQTAKMAIGHFASPEIGDYWGVNADVIGGKLVVGNNLIIENKTDSGVMQFKVDSSGAWLNNSSLVIQSPKGGKMLMHPDYGFAAGSGDLFTLNGTNVSPSFIDGDGNITYDSDGMPKGTNFYLSRASGSAYFRGKVKATSGDIGGWKIGSNKLYSGDGRTYVELNSNPSSTYAIWAGDNTSWNAPFNVRRDGTLRAKSAELTDGQFNGGEINGSAIKIGGNAWYQRPGVWRKMFEVEPNGDVYMQGDMYTAGSTYLGGDIHMVGNIDWGSNTPSISADELADIMANDRGSFRGFVYEGGALGISADYIRSGRIDTDRIYIGDSFYEIATRGGHDGICLRKASLWGDTTAL